MVIALQGSLSASSCLIIASTTVETPETQVSADIPTEYQDFQEAFSKAKTCGLPARRPYDYAIELLPGTTPPHNPIYPLSLTEQQAMEEYVQEALQEGYFHPATSPASAELFFVERKVGKLRPCINYCGLNQITVKY
ncbi:hypothetical protein PDJAM_G00105360 [Pangasius djambal]|uniref:Uncharacterized protein n=1 Tax=Pangasius djambal TaxID=1691987 RepID=A0ACC5Y0U5_9TELE|nr:hypothetical protein [Pangasius djambal]